MGRLEEIRSAHNPVRQSWISFPFCDICSDWPETEGELLTDSRAEKWPCDAAILLSTIEKLQTRAVYDDASLKLRAASIEALESLRDRCERLIEKQQKVIEAARRVVRYMELPKDCESNFDDALEGLFLSLAALEGKR